MNEAESYQAKRVGECNRALERSLTDLQRARSLILWDGAPSEEAEEKLRKAQREIGRVKREFLCR